MSPLPRSGAAPRPDPVWRREPPALEESFPGEHVEENFAEAMDMRSDVARAPVVGPDSVGTDGLDDDPEASVIDYLEAAVRAAESAGMSASELIGLLFYYAHNVAQEAREDALRALRGETPAS